MSICCLKISNRRDWKRCRFAVARVFTFASSSQAVDLRGGQRWVYQELRDRKVALFIDQIAGRNLADQLRDESRSPGRVSCVARVGPCDVRARDPDEWR